MDCLFFTWYCCMKHKKTGIGIVLTGENIHFSSKTYMFGSHLCISHYTLCYFFFSVILGITFSRDQKEKELFHNQFSMVLNLTTLLKLMDMCRNFSYFISFEIENMST